MSHLVQAKDCSAPMSLESVSRPHENDVLLGRGGNNNKHGGNAQLRSLARAQVDHYSRSSKKEKSKISRQLVYQVRAMDPPGRFLKRHTFTEEWEDVGDDVAREKASQALRDAVSTQDEPDVDMGASIVTSGSMNAMNPHQQEALRIPSSADISIQGGINNMNAPEIEMANTLANMNRHHHPALLSQRNLNQQSFQEQASMNTMNFMQQRALNDMSPPVQLSINAMKIMTATLAARAPSRNSGASSTSSSARRYKYYDDAFRRSLPIKVARSEASTPAIPMEAQSMPSVYDAASKRHSMPEMSTYTNQQISAPYTNPILPVIATNDPAQWKERYSTEATVAYTHKRLQQAAAASAMPSSLYHHIQERTRLRRAPPPRRETAIRRDNTSDRHTNQSSVGMSIGIETISNFSSRMTSDQDLDLSNFEWLPPGAGEVQLPGDMSWNSCE